MCEIDVVESIADLLRERIHPPAKVKVYDNEIVIHRPVCSEGAVTEHNVIEAHLIDDDDIFVIKASGQKNKKKVLLSDPNSCIVETIEEMYSKFCDFWEMDY